MMMNPNDLDITTRVSLLYSRLRNIIYYRLSVEPKYPERLRCQYMHILRSTREDLINLLNSPGISKEDYNVILDIVRLIPPKVKDEECYSTILNLENYLLGIGNAKEDK